VTIPDHRELRVGTLRGIVGDVAEYMGLSVESVVDAIFRD
jgi:hypothetical protein